MTDATTAPDSPPWRRFLLVKLPSIVLGLALALEVMALALSSSSANRHPLDRLVHDLSGPVVNADIVLIGDSVTQDPAGTYALAPAGDLVDLTTNQASGVVGSFLLLRRYLDRNDAPSMIVLASTPEFLGFSPSGATAEIYVHSVFRSEEEASLLAQAGLERDQAGWKPAVLKWPSTIVDPIIGLSSLGTPGLKTGQADPTTAPEPEGPGGTAIETSVAEDRAAKRLWYNPSAVWALGQIAALSQEIGASFTILIAPAPAPVHAAWMESGAFGEMREMLSTLPAPVRLRDMNADRSYPVHAFRDADHLRRPGWTALYAADLKAEIASLREGTK